VTVHCDARRRTHFAERVRGAPDVFDVHKRPWVQPDNRSAEFVAEVIRRVRSRRVVGRGQQTCYGPVVFVGSVRLTVGAHCVW
jgi:uncharacterized Fe-S cluster protein YjdI